MSSKTVCSYRGCGTKGGQGIALFRFPKDAARSRIWLEACNREDLFDKPVEDLYNNYRLCDKHFDEKYITKGGNRKRLFDQAFPTLFPHSTIHEYRETHKPVKKYISEVNILKPAVQPEHNKSEADLYSIPGPSSAPSHSIFGRAASIEEIKSPLPIPPISTHQHSESPELLQSALTSVETSAEIVQPPLLSPSISTQTSTALSFSTPRKKKLRGKIKHLQKKSYRKNLANQNQKNFDLEYFFKMCDQFLCKPLATIVKTQATLKDKKPIARRYSKEYKQFALTLYFVGPRAYMLLKKFLYLPSKRSLQLMTGKAVCRPGLTNNDVFEAFRIKVNALSDLDKHCILCIDEMSLKSNLFYLLNRDEIVGLHDTGSGKKDFLLAQNACVIMARALFSNWKQPIAYFFVHTQFKAADLLPLLKQCISKLFDIGLSVDAFISDMGSNFIDLSKILNVTPENPVFTVDNNGIFYIFDTCHLQKATRNNLLNNILKYDGKETSWKYVESFYNNDKKQTYRCAPKLTDSHIYPTSFDKMKVKYAVQVLSHSVASAMNTYISLGALPGDAMPTVEVIEMFNNLFDILNASATNNPNKYKNVFVGDDFQINYLSEVESFLSKLEVFNKKAQNVTLKCKFIKCWRITIIGVKMLWEKLSAIGFKCIKTRKVNQDCLENYFGSIRQQGGNCINPTPIQFEWAFRKLFCQNYLHSEYSNCNDDLAQLLTVLKTRTNRITDPEPSENFQKAITLPDCDYRTLDITAQNAFSYVCGYLVKKALNIHKCENCITFSKHCETLDTSRLLTYFKAHNTDEHQFGSLRTPPETFIHFVFKLEQIFVSMYSELSTVQGISGKYFNLMKEVQFTHPCPQFPIEYTIKLFIRLRIFYSLKYVNRDLVRRKGDKKNRKITILSHI